MDLIKKFCSDKGRVGVAIVCLLMLCIGLISSNAGETYALSSADYTCPGNTTPEEVDGEWLCYFFATDQMMCEGMLSGYTLHSFDADNSTCIGVAKRKTVTITFEPGDGLTEPIIKTYNSGDKFKNLPNVTRYGYEFLGWYTSANYKIGIDDVVPSVNTKYTAKWEAKCPLGGTVVNDYSCKLDTVPMSYSKWVIGDSFASDNDCRDYVEAFGYGYVNGASRCTYSISIYTLTFDSNGGSAVTPSSDKFGWGSRIDTENFPKPNRDNYNFLGWYYEDGEKIGDTITIYEDITLTAEWESDIPSVEPKTYLVTYDSNGGIGTMSPSTYTEGVSKELTKNTFTKTGYTFSGWNTKEDGSGTSYKDEESVTISEKSTLYAQWKANTYTVKYDANEGSGTMSSSKHAYDKELALTKNTFTREGYIFDGWNTKADGSGTDYKDGQLVKNLTDKNNDTITLYAQWIDEDSKENENPGTGTDGDGTENENPDSGNAGNTPNDDEKVEDSNVNDDKEDENPPTGSLATILVSMIGIVALVCFVFYYKKARV